MSASVPAMKDDMSETLRELLGNATPGPWEWVGHTLEQVKWSERWPEVLMVKDLPEHTYPELQSGELVVSEADAALIVAAVNALPALLDVAEAGMVIRGDPEFDEPGPLTIMKGQKKLLAEALARYHALTQPEQTEEEK